MEVIFRVCAQSLTICRSLALRSSTLIRCLSLRLITNMIFRIMIILIRILQLSKRMTVYSITVVPSINGLTESVFMKDKKDMSQVHMYLSQAHIMTFLVLLEACGRIIRIMRAGGDMIHCQSLTMRVQRSYMTIFFV